MDKKYYQKPYYNLYFVRHGESIGNRYGLLGGWTDVPLSDAGRKGLEDLVDKLPYPEADLYLYSGLKRAQETLEIIRGKGHDPRPDWRFSETFFGLMEASPPEEDELRPNFYLNFYHDVYQGFGEETFTDQRTRVLTGTRDLLEDLKNKQLNSAYVFSHYGTIKSNLASFTGQTTDDLLDLWIPNGSLWHFMFEEQNDGSADSGVVAGFVCRLIQAYYLGYETKELTRQVLLNSYGLSDEETLLP
ncbi:MAG: histidine phosphatase family protein [Eubacteriales bacterium]|nr:histidine phosphatase family protein [Eubacteriales bacterium]